VIDWIEHDLPLLPPDRQPILALQRAGDLLYLPAEWGHATLNLRETIGIAEEFFMVDLADAPEQKKAGWL
jgi:oxalate decarboxylase/phosphoglucose isomerase-like protein (cupin superfamily)